MTDIDCIVNLDMEESKMMEMNDCPPTKKFKQGCLPFKPLNNNQTLQGSTPPGSKKRKLSDNESPSAKQPKTSVAKSLPKPPVSECDPEVSSSSEADTSIPFGHQKGGKKLNTIDRFFKKKSTTLDQEEISSTNECIAIDLTDENECNENKNNDTSNDCVEKKIKNPAKDAKDIVEDSNTEKAEDDVKENVENLKKDGVEIRVKKRAKTMKDTNKSKAKGKDLSSDEKNSDKEVTVISEKEQEDEINDKEKSGETVKEIAENLESSFVEDTSVCENALKTPAKGKLSESLLKTPVVGNSAVTVTTPVSSQSQESASDATPISGKKKSRPLSDSKKKEQEARRLKLKEEKEKDREEKKKQKDKEKEEKEKERLEKKRQKDEEKAEKEKQRLEEKEKREKERLEKLQQKEEEKKQKEKELEAKLEEKKKKDEEKRQKEEEKKIKEEEKKKEDEEKLKKAEKKKSMFKGFFIQKAPTVSPPKTKEAKNSFFMPFEVKPNMKLAPEQRRRPVTGDDKLKLDELISTQVTEELYLNMLKSRSYRPRQTPTTWKRTLAEENDVEILSHEKETIEKVTHHVKYLYFHENTRPPYYGTWRKPSNKLTARNPYKQDDALFDYEVDSDDEWEEEEPGESVSSDEEEEEAEKVDGEDEEADEWMVPHGYLSDGEGVDDDEEVDNASKQDLQKVRQAAWESELKRQAKPLKMLSIGCVWQDDATTTIAAKQLETLLKFKAVCLIEGPISTSFCNSRTETSLGEGADEKTSRSNNQKKSVPETAIPDLIRLVHGNPIGIKNLIKEFRMFWKVKTNPDSEKTKVDEAANSANAVDKQTSNPDMNMEVDEKPESEKPKSPTENQDVFAISKRQLEIKIPAIAMREKRSDHKKKCWYVNEDILKQYNMEDITLPNSWEYICVKEPLWALDKSTPKADDSSAASTPSGGRATPNIMKFAQPMSPSMIQSIAATALSNKESVKSPAQGSDPTITVVSQSELPVKATLPSDQKTIKDMFSPMSKKSIKLSSLVSNSPQSAGDKIKSKSISNSPKNIAEGFNSSAPDVIEIDVDDAVPNTNQNKPKPSASSSLPIIANKDKVDDNAGIKEAPKKVFTTPKRSGQSIIDSVLTSPELMKISPKSHTSQNNVKITEKKKIENANLDKNSRTEPMQVDEVIILD